MNESQFIALIRPTIQRDDYTARNRIGAYVDQVLKLGGTRGSLARAVLDAFPDSRLAELIAEKINK
jgi:hypothetical protein